MRRVRWRPMAFPSPRATASSVRLEGSREHGHPLWGLGPPWWFLAVPACLVAGYLIAATAADRNAVAAANLLGPSMLGLAAVVAGSRLLREKPEAVWSAYAWFLAAIVAFYCVGPLLHSLAGPETRRLASSLYAVTPEALLRTNLLNAVGVLGVAAGVRLVTSLRPRRRSRGALRTAGRVRAGRGSIPVDPRLMAASHRPIVGAEVAAVTFLVIGGILQYLLILPSRFGMLHVVLPGVLWNLGRLHLLGIAVLAYIVARGSGKWRLPLAVLWGVQVAVSVLLFSKLELILSLVLPALGGYAGHRRTQRLVVWGVAVAAVYLAVPQFVLYGREQVYRAGGAPEHAGLAERAAIVRNWLERGRPSLNEHTSAVSTAWARLDYAPEQAFAMRRYDEGYQGNTLRYAGIVLVPRILWPQKPVTTDLGVDFYELATGRRSSHLGLGIFGEGYWNLGWPGTAGLSLATGVVFAIVSGLAIGWMRRREFLFLPAVALGLQMGAVGTTGAFANSIVGAATLLGVYAVAVSVLVRLLRSLPRRGTGASALPVAPVRTDVS